MDAISALFPFHDEFLQKVKDFVKEKMSTSTDNIEDFDQNLNSNIKNKEEIHTLHKNQHLCIDNLKTMLYLEAAKLDPSQRVGLQSTTIVNEGLQVLYDRCPPLSQRASACGDMAKKLNDRVLDFMPDNFNALWNRILLLNSIGNADGNADEEADHIMKILDRIARNTDVLLMAKAEVAGLYTYLKRESETLQNLNQDRQILYERCPTLSQRASANDRMLDFSEDHLNALWNRILLFISTDNAVDGNTEVEAEEEAEGQLSCENRTKLKILERIVRDTEVLLMAKAEVAGMYTYLEIESESLHNSICLYEEVLAQLGTVSWKTPSDSVLDSLIVFWKQDLLWNYKLLTFKQRHDEALSRAKSLVVDLDQSPVVDPKLKAKAWADLALIYEHHKPTYQNRWPCGITNTDRQQMRECFEKAMQLDPTNARIRMQAARELRKRPQTEPHLLQAIQWFEKSLEGENVEDIRGFILFHIGLTYRSLWIIKENPLDAVRVNAILFPSWKNKRSSHPHFEERVINPPIQPKDFCHLPPPYKAPADNSVGWRFLNPIARDPNNTYLLKARRCLQEASETDEERCMFLIELTRTYISTRDIAEARECLQRAQEDPCSDMVSVDFVGVSLYENMAFLEESEMMRTKFNETDTEMIKSLYRESIRQSTQSDWQPVVAFHCLLALLYKQLETHSDEHLPEAAQVIKYTDHMILQNEYFLLYMTIQEAEESREIVKSYATDAFRIAVMWRLIEMFNRRNQQYDAAAAFTYLSILVMANKLTTEVKGINFTAIEKQRMLLLSGERVAQQRVTAAETRYLLPQYKDLFDLCGADQEPESASGSASESLSDDEEKKLTIIMKIIKPDLRSCFPCRKERV